MSLYVKYVSTYYRWEPHGPRQKNFLVEVVGNDCTYYIVVLLRTSTVVLLLVVVRSTTIRTKSWSWGGKEKKCHKMSEFEKWLSKTCKQIKWS